MNAPNNEARLAAARLLQMEQYAVDARERTTILTEIALFALRTLTIINGGGIVALIALISQGANSPFVKAIPIGTIVGAFACFALGLVCCIAAAVIGYVSQLLISNFEQDCAQQLYEVETGQPWRTVDERPREIGNSLLNWGVLMAILSLVAFGVGAVIALAAAVYAATR